jgi:hypothetical protein
LFPSTWAPATPRSILRRFRTIVIEFHHLHRLFDGFSHRLIAAALARLTDDFYVVHAHPNNVAAAETRAGVTIPRLLEVTFVRKDGSELPAFATGFPHALDRDNVPSKPHMALPPSLIGAA